MIRVQFSRRTAAAAAVAVTAIVVASASPATALDLGSATQTVTSTTGSLTDTATGTVTGTTGTVTGTVGTVTGTTDTVGGTTDTVTGTAGSLTGTATDTVTGTAGSLTGTATDTAGSLTGTATDTVQGTTQTVTGTAGGLTGGGGGSTGTSPSSGSGTSGSSPGSSSSGGGSGGGGGSTPRSGGGTSTSAGGAGTPSDATNTLLSTSDPFGPVRGSRAAAGNLGAGDAAARSGLAPGVTPLSVLLAGKHVAPGDAASGSSSIGNSITNILRHIPDWSRPIIAALIALALLLWLRSALARWRLRRVRAERDRVAGDLEVLQRTLVPPLPEQIGAAGLSVAYDPAEGLAAGGDFYDAFPLAGGRVGIVVGDASGHGRDAIGRAAPVRYSLRAYLEAGLEPRAALRVAGNAGDSDSLDVNFATAIVAVHDPLDGTLTYACAGHPAPIVTGPAAHEPVTACASPPLGWGIGTGQRQTVVALPPGASAWFYTDGLVEAKRAGSMLGRDGLEQLIHEQRDGEGADALLARLRRMVAAGADDMAALVVRPLEGPATTLLRIEELEVTIAELTSGSAARFLVACGLDAARAEAALQTLKSQAEGHTRLTVRVAFRDGAIEVDARRPETAIADNPELELASATT